MPLDRVHLSRDARQHRRGVARAGADLQHALAAFQLERLDHVGNDVRLRDGLAFADRQRRVGVGEFLHLLADERLARHLAHGTRHRVGAHAALEDLVRHHLAAGLSKVCHGHVTS